MSMFKPGDLVTFKDPTFVFAIMVPGPYEVQECGEKRVILKKEIMGFNSFRVEELDLHDPDAEELKNSPIINI